MIFHFKSLCYQRKIILKFSGLKILLWTLLLHIIFKRFFLQSKPFSVSEMSRSLSSFIYSTGRGIFMKAFGVEIRSTCFKNTSFLTSPIETWWQLLSLRKQQLHFLGPTSSLIDIEPEEREMGMIITPRRRLQSPGTQFKIHSAYNSMLIICSLVSLK